ncbi:hypothetical protein BKA60DRAFT_536297 [Fusarium oxysporum]|nr:hypothetical protein BKA60DRAFT_536297 [Fusarium oxysporum]
MAANQSGRSDSERMVQQPRAGEQALEDTDPANLTPKSREVPVSTKEEKSPPATSSHDVKPEIDIETRQTGIKRKPGVFAFRDLPHGHEIIRAEQPIFVAPYDDPISAFAPLRKMRHYNMNATESVCLDKFKRDCAFQDPSGTRVLIYSLVSNINHACPDCAQATFLVAEAYDITVTLVKDVRAGEEIFIDFGEARSHFDCSLCNTREPIWKRRKRKEDGRDTKRRGDTDGEEPQNP